MYYRHNKHEELIEKLEDKRVAFAGIGTNKAKRRLNKLALVSVVAKAIRIALEIEDKNIVAKKYPGDYRERAYKEKHELIIKLRDVFRQQNWKFGVQKDDCLSASHVVYFEIPGCEQISWHFTPDHPKDFPMYDGKWDKKENSTLDKLESVVIKFLRETNEHGENV